MMMKWLSKPKPPVLDMGTSYVQPSGQSPPKKKQKTQNNVMMSWLNKAQRTDS